MLYALLAAISTPTIPIITPTPTIATPLVTAVLTPVPTPILTPYISIPPISTLIPPNAQCLFPDFFNFKDVNVLDVVGIIATILIGIAALLVSRNANRLIIQSNQREETLRTRETKIAVMDRAVEVYNFFIMEIWDNDFFTHDDYYNKRERIRQINYLSDFLFKKDVAIQITELLRLVWKGVKDNDFPDIPDDDKDEYKGWTKQAYFTTCTRKKVSELFEEYKLNL